MPGIREDLSDPVVIDEFERRFQAAMRRARRPQMADNGKRRMRVQQKIANLTDAIVSGALKSSPALAQRLEDSDDELAPLEAQCTVRRVSPAVLVPDVRGRFLGMIKGLEPGADA